MSKLNVILLVLVVVSALGVVRMQYEARRSFTALDVERQRTQQLQLDEDRLQVEVRTLSVPERIESLARDTLGMLPVTPARTDYVSAARIPAQPLSIPTR